MPTSRLSLVSPPPPYPSLQADPSYALPQTHPSPSTRPLLYRRASSPAALMMCGPSPGSVKPAQRSLLSRISPAVIAPTFTSQSAGSTQPDKLFKQRSPREDSCSLSPTRLPVVALRSDKQDEDNSSNFEPQNRTGQRQRLRPIIAFVTRTPVHFFTGDSEVVEVKTIWPDGEELVTRPNQITRSRPEEWRGWRPQ